MRLRTPYLVDVDGRVAEVYGYEITAMRGARVILAGANRDRRLRFIRHEDLDAATRDDWEEQRCLDRLA